MNDEDHALAHGGKRRGAGRPRGSRNKATLAREAAVTDAVRLAGAAAALTPERIAQMKAVDVLRWAMLVHVSAGNASVAADIASRLAPYQTARITPDIASPAEDARAARIAAMAADPDPETDPTRGTTRDGRVVKLAAARAT